MTGRTVVVHSAAAPIALPSADSRPAAVWMADAVRAIGALQAPPATVAAIADLLGLRDAAPTLVVRTDSTGEPTTGEGSTTQPAPRPTVSVATGGMVAAAESVPQDPTVPAEVRSDQTPERKSDPPRFLPDFRKLLPAPPEITLGSVSLLPPGQQRALVGELCSRLTPDGDIDIDTLVEQLTRREPLIRLPRRPMRTTRRGLQLLVDFGDGLRGFSRDRDEIWRLVTRLAGPDGLEVLRFRVTPLDATGAGPGRMASWRKYRPPAAGRPVLIISDLGTYAERQPRLAITDRWLEVARMLELAGCPVTALVPAPARRLPNTLKDAISIVNWDRTTTIRDAVNAARRAARQIRLVDA